MSGARGVLASLGLSALWLVEAALHFPEATVLGGVVLGFVLVTRAGDRGRPERAPRPQPRPCPPAPTFPGDRPEDRAEREALMLLAKPAPRASRKLSRTEAGTLFGIDLGSGPRRKP